MSFFLARDRLGIKPLYYVSSPGSFAFASEIKALLNANLGQRVVDRSAIFQYLGSKFVAFGQTAFKDICKIEPGQWLLVTRECEVTAGRFWDYRPNPDSKPRAENDYAAELRTVLQESVRDQMVADVPVGAFLSGGVDSSIIVSEMSRITGPGVEAFTVEYQGLRTTMNESVKGKRSANFARADHSLVTWYCGSGGNLAALADLPLRRTNCRAFTGSDILACKSCPGKSGSCPDRGGGG